MTPTTAVATVCLSGTLDDKLTAAADAGFAGVEIFEPDLVASPLAPAAIRDRCADLGLSIDLYQPFRDLDSTSPDRFAANLGRLERKLEVMRQLGTDTLLVCSSVSPDAVPDPDLLAGQLHTAAGRAADHGIRIAYEALAWGAHVNTYEASWDVVARAGHPALGLCLDSFHILSRGSDPAGIRDIPGEKLLFLQLADAPHLDMDVLQWSRHHRLFPGQGAWDLSAFLTHVLAAGYRGPLSLEVFNDVFRQADPGRTAIDAHRSLLALRDATARRAHVQSAGAVPAVPTGSVPTGVAFAEVAVDAESGPLIARALDGLGFTHTGHHRTKPVQLWTQGEARLLLNTGVTRPGGAISALGLHTADPGASAARAEALLAPVLPRTRGPAEADLAAIAAPDGTEVFFCGTGDDWLADFTPAAEAPDRPGAGVTRVDHIALTQPFDHYDEATLFYRAVLGLTPQPTAEYAAPFGLVRSRAFTDPAERVRIALSVTLLRRGDWAPPVASPQHIAFATDDIVATARAVRGRGAPLLAVPDNYYDDLDARLGPDPALLADLRELGIFYDRDADGAFLHCYTEILGGAVFFELVQRVGRYTGYGAPNAPVRMAAHRTARLALAQAGPDPAIRKLR
ncbi:bifunctional sugar phosphate isomerase/epimerase/4-hydroxyphenylpyruvate dioxygenase family protein [Streptomyces botrytidirepellens]|uniref:3-dehydroshikimate dehydratase n=1 Tax=Streptomyces botrytidirepellens TaxID=2486417 RepID=A0A3M8WEM0_9ACTN|nr:sugar phosphate isomerase/epimerase and 4-hydroxyphenylpyruvate domain-containing protein [Streptomyces botrytidirepellens]RNG28284.1 sugar phosphate isomerase/epimerase and 4-hydroxyphenylpyruvate domain-containing protein [Streptomyces botrytidirepellens]